MYKMAVRLCLYGAALATLLTDVCHAGGCDRTHDGRRVSDKTPTDGRYKLEVFDDPANYVPNTAYTVTLKAVPMAMHNKFIAFLLVAESESEDKPVGTFQITDFMTKYSDKCPNAVANLNFQQKTEITSLWTSPPPGSGCITLKATVIVNHEIWHMDDPILMKVMCESDQEMPEADFIIDPCCACDEAKYEVTFEGLWSRHTHPKDFPGNAWITRFSDVIGASHAADYRFWEYGQHASEGLKQLAEHGATKVLESELKAESEHIRTIIKARGISYPNLTGKTFAVFRVDSRHHLMSLVAMIDPSPDWIVGVSGLELCLRNCTWVDTKVIKLFPWDAGTDSGVTYTAINNPTNPRDVIRKIGPNFPNDPNSPFYDTSGKEMKPLARLILNRQRLYEKSCDGANQDDKTDPCAVSNWGPWSPCSVTCGKGKRHRQRTFKSQADADSSTCDVRLTEKQACWGPRRNCRVPSEYEPDPAQHHGPCAVSHWSTWSSCTSDCGQGYKVRTRAYRLKGAAKRCRVGLARRPLLQQTMKCIGRGKDCTEYADSDDSDGGNDGGDNEKCPVSPWSNFSPCSVSCGQGVHRRTRYKLDAPQKRRRVHFKEMAVRGLHEEPESNEAEEGDTQDEEYEADNSVDDPCLGVRMEEVTTCIGTGPDCHVRPEDSARICSQVKAIGPCRGTIYRWFFDVALKRCEPFAFSGCKGNRNNFPTLEECQRVCALYKEDLHRIEKLLSEGANNEEENFLSRPSHNNKTLKQVSMQNDGFWPESPELDSSSQTKCRPPMSGEITGPGLTGDGSITGIESYRCEPDRNTKTTIINQGPVGQVKNCILGPWSDWSPCKPKCGKGWKKKTREILQHAFNGGKRCGELHKTKLCKKLKPCNLVDEDEDYKKRITTSDPDYDSQYDEVSEREPRWELGIKRDCVLSDWSSWSPCAVTCGTGAFMQRTRYIVTQPAAGGQPCAERVENKNCDLMQCPLT